MCFRYVLFTYKSENLQAMHENCGININLREDNLSITGKGFEQCSIAQ